MFCTHCGKNIPDNVKFCTFCGAPQEQSSAQPAQPVQGVPVADQGISLNTEYKPAPKKKLGKGPIIAIAAAVVAVVVAVVLIFTLGGNKQETLKNGPANEYMQSIEKDAVGELSDSVSSAYGSVVQMMGGKADAGAPSGSELDLHIKLSDSVMSLAETMLAQEGADIEISWLNDILLEVDGNIQGSNFHTALAVGLGDVRIVTIDVIMNMDKGVMYMGIPELSKEYVQFELADLYGAADIDPDEIAAAMSQFQGIADKLPDEATINKLLNKYIGIALEQIDDVEKLETTLTVDGLSQNATELRAKIGPKTIADVCIAVLKEVRNDKELKNVVKDVFDAIAEPAGVAGSVDFEQIYSMLQGEIDALVEDMEKSLETMDEETLKEFIGYSLYLDGNGAVIGRELDMSAIGTDVPVYYYNVTEGSEVAFEMNLADSLTIKGEGSINGNLTSGTYVFAAQGVDMLNLEIIDAATNGDLKGTYRLSLCKGFADMVAQEMNDSTAASIISQVALEMKFDGNGKTSSGEVGIVVAGTPMLSITYNMTSVNGGKINMPSGGYDGTNENDLMNWVSTFKFDTIANNLKRTNMPQEYKEIVDQLLVYMGSALG